MDDTRIPTTLNKVHGTNYPIRPSTGPPQAKKATLCIISGLPIRKGATATACTTHSTKLTWIVAFSKP